MILIRLIYLIRLICLVHCLLPDRQDRPLEPDRPFQTQLRPLTYSTQRLHLFLNHLRSRDQHKNLLIGNMLMLQLFTMPRRLLNIRKQHRIEFPIGEGLGLPHWVGQE